MERLARLGLVAVVAAAITFALTRDPLATAATAAGIVALWFARASLRYRLDVRAHLEAARYAGPQSYWEWHAGLYPQDWPARRRAALGRDGACMWCGATEELDVDHVVPLSEGGSSEPENLQTLCHDCHEWKTGRPIPDAHRPEAGAS